MGGVVGVTWKERRRYVTRKRFFWLLGWFLEDKGRGELGSYRIGEDGC